MKSKKIKNSKYKCTGVLFELLVRQITADTLSGRPISEAVTILKKYFNANTELGKELQLYRAFFESGKLTETRALHFIDLIVEQRRKLDDRKLSREKYDLIKEVKLAYSLQDFLSARISNYTVNASIYKTFSSHTTDTVLENITNIQDIANAKFTLVEHLSGIRKTVDQLQESESISEFKAQPEDIRMLTLKYAIDRFNKKYENFNDKQKQLLREYITNVSSTNSLVSYVRQEVPTIKEALLEKAALPSTNDVIRIKIEEVAKYVGRIGSKPVVKDNEISALMVAYEILKEIE